jgi:hypothetical protein
LTFGEFRENPPAGEAADGLTSREDRYKLRLGALYRRPSRRPPDFRSPNSNRTLRVMLGNEAIQALRPDESRSGTKHHDRDGLSLWVARCGSKTWRKDFRWEGVDQTFTIGSHPRMRLAEARKIAMQVNAWLKAEIDPRTQTDRQRRQRERPEAKPVRELAEAWFQDHATAWSPRDARGMRRKLDNFALPAMGRTRRTWHFPQTP